MADRNAWLEPGCHEQAPGVYRIPLPLPNDGLRAVNVYAIADGEQVVLIDGGWALAEAEQLLADALDTIGYGLRDIREFLVTHVHRDHYTQAVVTRRHYGTPVALGEGEKASLQVIRDVDWRPGVGPLRAAGAAQLAELAASRPRELGEVQLWEDPDRWLADGIDIELKSRTLRVIATPGHTRGHVVFHDAAAGTLFAGDHVLPHITPSIGLQPARAESPLRDYLNSLRLIQTMPDSTLLPAHGPAAPSTHARVAELLAHHDQRLTATAEAVAKGASTGFEVANALDWTRRRRRFAELDTFNQMMAVHETVAHLQVLVERGWLRRTPVDGVVHFSRA